MALLARIVFGAAAAAAALGGSGMIVAPHVEPPGTPVVHEHSVGALRFPMLLIGDVPGVPTSDAQRIAADRHGSHIPLTAPDGTVLPTLENAHALALLAGGVVLALFSLGVPRLPRPSRYAISEIAKQRLTAVQWLRAVVLPPPRVGLAAF